MKLNKNKESSNGGFKGIDKKKVLMGIFVFLGITLIGIFSYFLLNSDSEDEYSGNYDGANIEGYSGKKVTLSDDVVSANKEIEDRAFNDAIQNNQSIITDIDTTAGVIVDGLGMTRESLLGMSSECLEGAEYDADGFNCITGFNASGCDKNGETANGGSCSDTSGDLSNTELCVERIFGLDGFDQFGVNSAGYSRSGFNSEGYTAAGFDKFGYNKQQFNKFGCNRENLDSLGRDCQTPIYGDDGFDQFGYSKSGIGRDGFFKSGCSATGLNRSGKPCSSIKFGDDGRDQFGFDKNGLDSELYDRWGFNSKGCNRKGLDKSGRICEPLVYGDDGYDQFGFDENGRNRLGIDRFGFDSNGCHTSGIDKNGDVCDPLIYGENGLDQYGYALDGFNENNCNRQNLNRDGEPCVDDSELFNSEGCTVKGFDKHGKPCGDAVYGIDGFSQFGLDSEGYGSDGFNAQNCNKLGVDREGRSCSVGFNSTAEFRKDGCNSKGLNAQGQLCKEPVYGADGKDEFGFDEKAELDSEGYDRWGFNSENCDRSGHDKNGKPCGTPVISADGFDQFGWDSNNCGRDGISKYGEPCGKPVIGVDGFDQFGWDSNNCGRDGISKSGEPCGKPIIGADGFSQFGLDSEGYGRDGFNAQNCSREGVDRSGKPCGKPVYGADGFDQYGKDASGYGRDGFLNDVNRFGCSRSGVDVNGNKCNPNVKWGDSDFGIDGRDKLGFSELGIDVEGYRRNGINNQNIDRFGCTAKGYDLSGFSCATGLDREGFDISGCNVYSKNRSGNACIPVVHEKKWDDDGFGLLTGLNRLGFNRDGLKNGFNEFGVSRRGYDRLGCNSRGVNSSGYSCTTGFNSLGIDSEGYLKSGLHNKTKRDRDGKDVDGYYKNGLNDAKIDRYGCDINGLNSDSEPCSNEVEFNLSRGEDTLLKNYVKSQAMFLQALEESGKFSSTPLFAKGMKREETNKSGSSQGGGDFGEDYDNFPVGINQPFQPQDGFDGEIPANDSLPVRIPLMTTMLARIACEINTDYQGDTCAEIISGPLSGAMLRGQYEVPFLERVDMPRDKVKITFNQLIWRRQTIDIEAVAVNMETFSEFVSSDVDYHRAYRWGGLAMATGIDLATGYIIGAAASGDSDSDSGGTAMAIQVAISEPLKETSNIYRGRMARPPTVTMFVDEQVGVLFSLEVTDVRVPFVYEDNAL